MRAWWSANRRKPRLSKLEKKFLDFYVTCRGKTGVRQSIILTAEHFKTTPVEACRMLGMEDSKLSVIAGFFEEKA